MFDKALNRDLSAIVKQFRNGMREAIIEMIKTKEVKPDMTLEQFVEYLKGNVNAT